MVSGRAAVDRVAGALGGLRRNGWLAIAQTVSKASNSPNADGEPEDMDDASASVANCTSFVSRWRGPRTQ